MTAIPQKRDSAVPQPAPSDDQQLVAALRLGDEQAFITLVELYHPSLVRVAAMYVADRAVAEEVAQETWVGVLQGLPHFEGRSSLKTWIFHILTNRAKTRGQREGRSVPFSALAREADDDEPAVEPERFLDRTHPRLAGHWARPPASWAVLPEERMLSAETAGYLQAAIAALPASQREVIRLRDVEGWSAAEVCAVFGISEANQRVLLHRARARVRRALEAYFGEERR